MSRPAGISRAAATATRDRKPVLLTLGDSVTEGVNVTQASRYHYLLQAHLQTTYGLTFTLELGGSTGGRTTGNTRTNPNYWQGVIADVVAIELGINNHRNMPKYPSGNWTNDAQGDQDAVDAWNTDVAAIIATLQANNPSLDSERIVIIGHPPGGQIGTDNEQKYYGGDHYSIESGPASLMSWNARMAAFCTAGGYTYIPGYDIYDPGVGHYDPTTDGSDFIKDDDAPTNVHPNAAGHNKWYEQIVRYLPTFTFPARYNLSRPSGIAR